MGADEYLTALGHEEAVWRDPRFQPAGRRIRNGPQ